ncbi:hypothetical protein ACPA1H_16050 [Ectopseudomonas chengduensis]|nr:hypothetical protein [Pseudomonas alcaliphila]
MSSQPVINVHHFVNYANLQSQLRKSSLVIGLTGPIGVAILNDQKLPVGEVLTNRIDSSVFDKTAGG